ncbi:hypothetical protein ACWGJ9_09235 [Curtobacterium citreum]
MAAERIVRNRDVGGASNDTRFGEHKRPAADVTLSGPPASTLTEVLKASEADHALYVDDTTPEGHFNVTVKVLGVVTTYTLKGEVGDLDAPIVEREEIHGERGGRQYFVRYVGNRLKGGTLSERREPVVKPKLADRSTAELRDAAKSARARIGFAERNAGEQPNDRAFAREVEAAHWHYGKVRAELEQRGPLDELDPEGL